MNGQLSKQISIAKHIINGSITIDSVQEFQGVLQIFPNDPALHRAYADLLVRSCLPGLKMADSCTNGYANPKILGHASKEQVP